MNLIIPMAGRGSRLRPHTLTVPKPLVHVAGKPIVQRLVEDLAAMTPRPFDHIAFVIGDFGPEVEADLLALADSHGATGHIRHQEQPLGTPMPPGAPKTRWRARRWSPLPTPSSAPTFPWIPQPTATSS